MAENRGPEGSPVRLPILRPPALRPGDLIAIVAPSGGVAAFVPRRFERGVAYLEKLSYRVRVMPHARGRLAHRAARYEDQAADLNQAFADPEVRMILTTIGGYTSNGVLRFLDWDLIRRNPKIVIGYSDTTALLTGIHTRTGLVTLYGPALLPTFAEHPEMLPYSRESFLDVVAGKTPRWAPSPVLTEELLMWDEEDDRPRRMRRNAGWRVLRAGRARGPLIGGNLTVLLALAGTPYFPDVTGKILCIEDDSESPLPYYDLHLNQLREMGVFDRIAGLLIGRPQGLMPAGDDASDNGAAGDAAGSASPDDTSGDAAVSPPGYGFAELLQEQLGGYDFPIAWGVDFGHTDPMLTLPLGVLAAMDTDSQTLTLLEPAVAG